MPSTLSAAAAGYATSRDSPTSITMSTFYDYHAYRNPLSITLNLNGHIAKQRTSGNDPEPVPSTLSTDFAGHTAQRIPPFGCKSTSMWNIRLKPPLQALNSHILSSNAAWATTANGNSRQQVHYQNIRTPEKLNIPKRPPRL